MARLGNMYGPDATFVGVPAADLAEPPSLAGAAAVIIGAPYDGGTSHRPGARFGPQAIRLTDYLPHDGSRPHLALGVDPLRELGVVDVGDIEMPAGEIETSMARLEAAVLLVASSGAMPVILGGDHTIAWPDVTGVARHVGWGRVSVIHFDAHADTGNTQHGSLIGHGTPMRRLIESGAARGDRFLQVGLRGYWPEPPTLAWMAAQGMRSFEMTEVTARGLDACLSEAMEIAVDGCDGVFLSVDVDVVDPGAAPGTGTPEPGGLSGRQLLDAVRRIAMEVPLAGMDVVEVAPPYDSAEITAYLANRVVLEALSGVAWRRRQAGAAKGQGGLTHVSDEARAGGGGRGARPAGGEGRTDRLVGRGEDTSPGPDADAGVGAGAGPAGGGVGAGAGPASGGRPDPAWPLLDPRRHWT